MMPTGYVRYGKYGKNCGVSILVLLDDAYRLIVRYDDDSGIKQFQSLFFWMMPTGLRAEQGEKKQKIMFQSLFFWMMPTGQQPTYSEKYVNMVSILVLLDDAYRPTSALTSAFP